MPEEAGRTLRPEDIDRISKKLKDERKKFMENLDLAISNTRVFAEAVVGAIGDISIDEAYSGIIQFFKDELRRK